MSSTHVYIRETAVGFPTTEYLVRVNNAERDALTAFINHWRETRHHALLEGRGLWHWFDVVTGTTVSDARIAYTATNTPLPAETPDFFTTPTLCSLETWKVFSSTSSGLIKHELQEL